VRAPGLFAGFLGLVALTLALAAAAPAAASSGASRLLHSGCPQRFPLPLRHYGPERIAQTERGIARILGRKRRLKPPIDWHQDPFHSYPWEKKLNELSWLDPLIYADLHGVDARRATRRARNVVLDWIRQNPRPSGFRAAWERKRAGDRLTRISFVARRAACEGLLDRSQAGAILASVREHAHFLLADVQPGGPTNHTLLRDQGLLIGAKLFGFLGAADHWRSVALGRFESVLRILVDRRTGVHLEHTPGYEQKTINHVEVVVGLLPNPPARFRRLLKRMKLADAWFTMPDGDIVPIADTPFRKPAPENARRIAAGLTGLSRYLRDGFAIARRGGSYLAMVAGYFRRAHKHADELTFDLFDHGRRVIVDTGRRDHTQVAGKGVLPGPVATAAFTLSSFAHSTLVVDGQSFDLRHSFYGSALDAEGAGDGWYAILGHNPLVRPQGCCCTGRARRSSSPIDCAPSAVTRTAGSFRSRRESRPAATGAPSTCAQRTASVARSGAHREEPAPSPASTGARFTPCAAGTCAGAITPLPHGSPRCSALAAARRGFWRRSGSAAARFGRASLGRTPTASISRARSPPSSSSAAPAGDSTSARRLHRERPACRGAEEGAR